MATLSDDGVLRIWDMKHDHPAASLDAGFCFALVPNEPLVVLGNRNGRVTIQELIASENHYRPAPRLGQIDRVEFSCDGGLLLTHAGRFESDFHEHFVSVWDAQSEAVLFEGRYELCNHLAFSPGGGHVAFIGMERAYLNPSILTIVSRGSGEPIKIDVSEGRLGSESDDYYHIPQIVQVAFSPDDRLVLTLSDSGAIKLWDPENGGLLACIREQDDRTYGNEATASFNPDGSAITYRVGSNLGMWQLEPRLRKLRRSTDPMISAPATVDLPKARYSASVSERGETMITRTDTGEAVAFFQVALSHLVAHPRYPIWAGSASDLYILKLEPNDLESRQAAVGAM